jgi:hypothetical protein
MIAELENIMTLTENRALVTEQATQNESDPALGVRRPEIPVPLSLFARDATVLESYEYVFAPWVKMTQTILSHQPQVIHSGYSVIEWDRLTPNPIVPKRVGA